MSFFSRMTKGGIVSPFSQISLAVIAGCSLNKALNVLAEHNNDKRNVKTALEAYEQGDTVALQESYNCITNPSHQATVIHELNKNGDIWLIEDMMFNIKRPGQ